MPCTNYSSFFYFLGKKQKIQSLTFYAVNPNELWVYPLPFQCLNPWLRLFFDSGISFFSSLVKSDSELTTVN